MSDEEECKTEEEKEDWEPTGTVKKDA